MTSIRDTNRSTRIQSRLTKFLISNRAWLFGAADTKEASGITGIPVASLTTLRSTGGGPPFFQPTPRAIRYLRIDLYDWMFAGGIKENTASQGVTLDVIKLLEVDGGDHASSPD